MHDIVQIQCIIIGHEESIKSITNFIVIKFSITCVCFNWSHGSDQGDLLSTHKSLQNVSIITYRIKKNLTQHNINFTVREKDAANQDKEISSICPKVKNNNTATLH